MHQMGMVHKLQCSCVHERPHRQAASHDKDTQDSSTTSLHHSDLNTQHPLSSGTDTHVGPEVPVQTPRPSPTSDFLSPPSSPQGFVLKKFVARIEPCPLLRSRHWGAFGRCLGFFHQPDTPRKSACECCVQDPEDSSWQVSVGLWIEVFCTSVSM